MLHVGRRDRNRGPNRRLTGSCLSTSDDSALHRARPSKTRPCNAISSQRVYKVSAIDLNEAAFVRRVVGGDPEAFRLLFDRLERPLTTFLERMGIRQADAEELAADALLKAHKSVHTFRSDRGAKLTTWVFQIARNCGLDHIRALTANREDSVEFWLEFNRSTTQQEPIANTDHSTSRIHQAMGKLDPKDQDLLRLHLVMDYDEIAKADGGNVGTVRVRHKRAFDRLKQHLKEN